jgi:hypothetical protein
MHHRNRPPKNSQSSPRVQVPTPSTMEVLAPKEPTPTHKTYHNQTYRFRTLENVTLYNCTITNSKIINSKLFSCTIGHTCDPSTNYLHSQDTWARNCKFTNCSISSARIIRSQIEYTNASEKQVILDSVIETSTLKNAVIQNGDLLSCVFERCQLYDSRMEDYKMVHSSAEGCLTSRAVSLKKLAPEIRMLIFSFCDLSWIGVKLFDWNYGVKGKGKMPTLVAACRVDQLLYGEAMEEFHKHGNMFHIGSLNSLSRHNMSPAAWQTVTYLLHVE